MKRPTGEEPAQHPLTAWNKAQRRLRQGLCTLAAAGALTLGFNTAAQAQSVDTKPPATAVVTAPDKHAAEVKADYAFSNDRLVAIETRMRKTGLGRELLDFAAAYGVQISMSNSKVMDDNPQDGFIVKGTYGGKQIHLNGEEKSDDEILLTLVHELRHAWHHFVIHENAMRLDPTHMLTKDRLLEADVFAFEIHFAYEYEKATGVRLDLGDRINPCDDDDESSACLLSGYAADRATGAEAPAAYGRLITRTLEHVHAEEYDADFLSSQNDNWQSVIDNPGTGLAWFGVGDKGLTPDADFAATLRRVATVGMTPGQGVSALKDWKDADFSSLAKTSGVDEAEVKGLDASIRKFNEAQNAWAHFWTEFLLQNPEIRIAPDAQLQPGERPMIRDGVHPPRPGQNPSALF